MDDASVGHVDDGGDRVDGKAFRDSIYWLVVLVIGLLVACFLLAVALLWALSGLGDLLPAQVAAFVALIGACIGMMVSAVPDERPKSRWGLGKRSVRTWFGLVSSVLAVIGASAVVIALMQQ